MAYLICIGGEGGNSLNLSGVGSRGYQVFRRKNVVTCRWGGVHVTTARVFAWNHAPREKRYVLRSRVAARDFLARTIKAREAPHESYRRLPRGVRIR